MARAISKNQVSDPAPSSPFCFLFQSITNNNITIETRLPDNKTVNAIRVVNSHVIAATVPGVTLTNLQTPVEIQFRHFSVSVCSGYLPLS